MFGASEGERLLANLFYDQYGDEGANRLTVFLNALQEVELPFSLPTQMRKQDHPGFPGFECGLPPKYYYFVEGAKYGGHLELPEDPLHPTFVTVADGIGLNFGCPLRLERAIAVLLNLESADQVEIRRDLAVSTKHLDTVEELLWAGLWKPPFKARRPKLNKTKSFDWKIDVGETAFNLECKFRPATWAKLVDREDFELMRGSLAKKASEQLPQLSACTNIVAITGIAAIDDPFRRLCYSELRAYPNVEVIIYSDIVGQAAAFSLSKPKAQAVISSVEPWRADQFGGFSTVTTFRPETARRSASRKNRKNIYNAGSPPDLVEIQVEHLSPRKIHFLPPPEYPYRFQLKERLSTGEPIFEWIPPFLRE